MISMLYVTYIEIIADGHHGCIAACALTLDLDDGELAVLRRLAGVYAAQVVARRFEDVGGPAEHARCRRAHLHKVLANGLTAGIISPRGTK